jgi:hypothetical protein
MMHELKGGFAYTRSEPAIMADCARLDDDLARVAADVSAYRRARDLPRHRHLQHDDVVLNWCYVVLVVAWLGHTHGRTVPLVLMAFGGLVVAFAFSCSG